MSVAREIFARLRAGNKRYVSGETEHDPLSHQERRTLLSDTQAPSAIVLGCSDSRVPAELVFDQGLGDLFVIRVAGNIVAPSQVGSVEFAAAQYGVRLVVVLGHTKCGAIQATLDQLQQPSELQSKNLASIVSRIQPVVSGLLRTDLRKDAEALRQEAVRANVRASADHLRHGSTILEDLILNDGLVVVGAEYCLETGAVDFFDGVPSDW